MSRWLASIRNLEEAKWLLAEPPDIIDLKEPRQGALGALPLAVVRQAVTLIKGRCQISATIGDLPMEPVQIRHAVEEMAATGVDYVKIGLFPDSRVPDCLMALQPLVVQGISLVGVMFADQYLCFSWILLMRQAGFKGVMLDTATKDGRSLLSHLSLNELNNFVELIRSYGLVSGLAGSLQIQDIPKLLPLKPDYLGFRSALCCAGQRESSFDPKAIFLLKRALDGDRTMLKA
jgi:dihydroneopterin aldolase